MGRRMQHPLYTANLVDEIKSPAKCPPTEPREKAFLADVGACACAESKQVHECTRAREHTLGQEQWHDATKQIEGVLL